MPVVYLGAGVVSGSLAGVSTFAMGHPFFFALLMYSVFGCLAVFVTAMVVRSSLSQGAD